MITKFEKYKLITESPDIIFIKEEPYVLDVESPDSKPFFCEVNNEHNKVVQVYFGQSGYHSDMQFDSPTGVYYGRLWLNSKIISFWIYPKDDIFVSIIKKMEENLNIKMFNNNWRIEVVKKNDEIVKTKDTPSKSTYSNNNDYNGKTELISIDDYVGSENFSEKEKLWHLMNAKEKQEAIRAGKRQPIIGGSHLTAWDQPMNIRWRQALRQESKKY